jgi:hypothetical protein
VFRLHAFFDWRLFSPFFQMKKVCFGNHRHKQLTGGVTRNSGVETCRSVDPFFAACQKNELLTFQKNRVWLQELKDADAIHRHDSPDSFESDWGQELKSFAVEVQGFPGRGFRFTYVGSRFSQGTFRVSHVKVSGLHSRRSSFPSQGFRFSSQRSKFSGYGFRIPLRVSDCPIGGSNSS